MESWPICYLSKSDGSETYIFFPCRLAVMAAFSSQIEKWKALLRLTITTYSFARCFSLIDFEMSPSFFGLKKWKKKPTNSIFCIEYLFVDDVSSRSLWFLNNQAAGWDSSSKPRKTDNHLISIPVNFKVCLWDLLMVIAKQTAVSWTQRGSQMVLRVYVPLYTQNVEKF